MRTLYYFLIGILLFYIDTAIGLLIPMHIGKFELVFVPHLTFMYILMMVVYQWLWRIIIAQHIFRRND